MCPGQNDIHFLFTVGHWVVTGGDIFISVSSFVCLSASRIMQKLLHRFSQNSVEMQHMDQWLKKRLDFVGNSDLDQDPGIFWMNYATAVLAAVKAPHSVFDSSVKIHRLVRIRKWQLNWFDHHSKFGCCVIPCGRIHSRCPKYCEEEGLGVRRSWVVYFMSGRKWKSRNCFRFVCPFALPQQQNRHRVPLLWPQTRPSRISERLFSTSVQFSNISGRESISGFSAEFLFSCTCDLSAMEWSFLHD